MPAQNNTQYVIYTFCMKAQKFTQYMWNNRVYVNISITCHKGHHDHLHSVITMHFVRFLKSKVSNCPHLTHLKWKKISPTPVSMFWICAFKCMIEWTPELNLKLLKFNLLELFYTNLDLWIYVARKDRMYCNYVFVSFISLLFEKGEPYWI